MAKDTVSNRQLYDAILDVHKTIDEVVEKRITPLEVWRANITGQFAMVTVAVGIGINFLFDWVKEKFLKI